ncbi:MAG: hypothetical protein ACRDGS_14035 [Chloroflexota bacterium]
MKLLFSDTDARTEALYLVLLRERGVAARLAAMQGLNAGLRALLISDPVPLESPKPLDQPSICYRIAGRLARAGVLTHEVMSHREDVNTQEEDRLLMQPDGIAATLLVTEALEGLKIPYVIGGSFASIAHGIPRATNDSDLVIGLRPDQGDLITALVARLEGAFLVSRESALDALAHQASFNAIHLDSLFKVDIFLPRLRLFEQARLARGRRYAIGQDPARTAVISSPEDTVLAKLEWYRLGNEISEKQWSDIQGILKLQGAAMDHGYLRQWAPTLNVADLLSRAMGDAGIADVGEGA